MYGGITLDENRTAEDYAIEKSDTINLQT